MRHEHDAACPVNHDGRCTCFPLKHAAFLDHLRGVVCVMCGGTWPCRQQLLQDNARLSRALREIHNIAVRQADGTFDPETLPIDFRDNPISEIAAGALNGKID